MSYGYIYKFTNLLNDKIYVGKHKYEYEELDKKYLTSGVLINASINKYGLDNFNQEIVCFCLSLSELNEMEKYYIKFYDCMVPKGYNLTSGGDGISEPSEEILLKNREAHLGKQQSEYTKLKRIETLKKVIHTKEWCEKISKANKGQIIPEYQKQIISEAHKGTHWYHNDSEEFLLFEDDEKIISLGLVRGRIKNYFPSTTGIKHSVDRVEKMKNSKSGSYWVNNGINEYMIHDEVIPEGFVKGRLKFSMKCS